MTPPGYIHSDGRGGLRVTIEEVEHSISHIECFKVLVEGGIADLCDPDPAPRLRGEWWRQTGHVVPSCDDGDETPHLTICVYPDCVYAALTAEVRAVREGRLDICKVERVSASGVE